MIEAYKQTIKEKDMQLQDLRNEYANLQVLMVKVGEYIEYRECSSNTQCFHGKKRK